MTAVRKRTASSIEQDPHVSVAQAAREIDRAPATVKTLALAGEIESRVSAGRVVITRESLNRYKARHGIGERTEAVTR